MFIKFIISFLILLVLMLTTVASGCKVETEELQVDSLASLTENEKAATEEAPDKETVDEIVEPEVDQFELIEERIEEFINSIEIQEDEFLNLDYKDKEYLIDIAYRAVDDYFSGVTEIDESLFLEKYDDIENKVYIGFRVIGYKKGSYSAKEENLAKSVYIATQRTIQDTRYDGSITETHLDRLKIEIFIIGEEKILDEGYEKGIHGIRLEKSGQGATFYNSVAVEKNYSLEKLLQRLCLKAGLSEDCSDDEAVNINYFPTIHFASTRFSDEITTFYRCNVIEKKPGFDLEKIKDSLDMAEGWMLLNLDEDGYFNYEYYPWKEEYSTSNNMIRQLMSSRWLAEVSSKNEALQHMHKVNLDYVLRNWYREDEEFGYIYFDNKSKIGATAMALRTLAYSPYLEDYMNVAQKLASNILSLQNEDGSFNAWYIEPEYAFDEEMLLRFYSGETILALIDFYEATGEDKYLEAAIKSQDYYLGEYIGNLEEDENYYPAFIPWHAQCLNKLYKITGDKKYSDAIFKITDKVLELQDQKGKPYIDFLGRFYNPETPQYGSPHSASTSVYLEGVAYAYEIAEIVEDLERMYEYKKSIILGTHNLMNLQFKGADMYYMANPQRVWGAIRVGVESSRIRIDTTGHTIDAFRKIVEVFELD